MFPGPIQIKHDNQCGLSITTEPAGIVLENHRYEAAFAEKLSWRPLGSGESMTWTNGIAGHFLLRAKAEFDGNTIRSVEVPATVQFPTREQILADGEVKAAMDAEWQQILIDSTPAQYQERSFVVYLNSKTNAYEIGSYDQSGFVAPGNVIYFFQPALIEPYTLPNTPGVRYPVATFHTHTPEEFAPANYPGRNTGPLAEDEPMAFDEKTPGFVYDYVESPIYSGYAETNSAKIYGYGPVRKAIPTHEE